MPRGDELARILHNVNQAEEAIPDLAPGPVPTHSDVGLLPCRDTCDESANYDHIVPPRSPRPSQPVRRAANPSTDRRVTAKARTAREHPVIEATTPRTARKRSCWVHLSCSQQRHAIQPARKGRHRALPPLSGQVDVVAEYGWPADITNEDVLRELLALNGG